MAVLLIRHAVALPRASWKRPDVLRPLSKRGERQAVALVGAVAPFTPVVRVLSSPSVRCIQTVEPLARSVELAIEETGALAEGNSDEALALVRKLAQEQVVLCSHGDVVPDVLEAIAEADGVDLGDLRCKKGSTWVLTSRNDRFVGATYLPPPA